MEQQGGHTNQPQPQPATALAKGRLGEDLAAEYLTSIGYHIVQANFHARGGEIDIVARDGSILVFVEVRYRAGDLEMAAQSVDEYKMQRIVAAARQYLHKNKTGAPCRFDVVILPDLTAADQCLHIKDAFNLADIRRTFHRWR